MLAVYVTYDPPSYRSVMKVLRLRILRHGRLPQELVVDGGTKFGSVYFETSLSRYFITKLERSAGEPRAGAVIERLFETARTEFTGRLLGNTQANKIPRQRTRAVDPKRLAAWTLECFSARLMEWADTVYDQRDHPALGMSPHHAYDQGVYLAGACVHLLIPYSEEFLMLTHPTTRTGRESGCGAGDHRQLVALLASHHAIAWCRRQRRPGALRAV